jgi:hypothetical protein
MKNYYSCVPSLAWILGHYFYNGTHYTWIAEEYFPYRLPNPKSSNPHLIYQDLYQPWKDSDDFDKFVIQSRINLRKGVIAQELSGTITTSEATDLKDICDKIEIVFFYPIIYRMDIFQTGFNNGRLRSAGSAGVGSHEYLISDLKETEFEVIFLDFHGDPDFSNLMSGSAANPLTILKGRC